MGGGNLCKNSTKFKIVLNEVVVTQIELKFKIRQAPHTVI